MQPGYYEIAVYNTLLSENKKTLARTSIAVLEDYTYVANGDSSPFAVNTHIGNFNPGWDIFAVDRASLIGAMSIRDGYHWDTVEKTKGVYDWTIMEARKLANNDMGHLYVAAFTNEFYDGGATPYTNEGRQGYTNYCNGLFTIFPRNYPLKNLELYNEWWGRKFGDRGDGEADSKPSTYLELVKNAYTQIKQLHPEANLLTDFGPDDISIYGDVNWNKEIIDLGILDYTDTVSLHSYPNWDVDRNPERTLFREHFQNLKQMMENKGNIKPIWLTETGYITLPEDVDGKYLEIQSTQLNDWGMDEMYQAVYLPRVYLVALSEGIKKIFWYSLMDESAHQETNINKYFGLLRSESSCMGEYSPKPSYVTYAVMTRMLDTAVFETYNTDGSFYDYVFGKNGKKIHIIFNIDENKTVKLSANDSVTVTDLFGRTREYVPENGIVELSVGDRVQYLEGSFTFIDAD